MSHLPIAAQMYTVREAAAQDLRGALRRVAEIGYDGVELIGTSGLTATELSDTLAGLGLTCVSGHIPLAGLRTQLDREIETYRTLGASYLICPWLPPEERGDAAGYRTLAAELNGFGERCRAAGLPLCYHHHDFELVQFDGRYALDILLEESDPAHLKLEADTYWFKAAGVDPAGYIRRWPERVPLVHLKDMSTGPSPTFAEVGTGILDWPDIFEAAQTVGTQWYIVEQDTCPGDPFDSLKLSLDNLRNMLAD